MSAASNSNWAIKYAHTVCSEVPAYKKFLNENGIQLQEETELGSLPIMDKDNYLRRYPLVELLPGGDFRGGNIISVSSGTSGKPYFWVRGKAQHIEAADIYEGIYKEVFHIDKLNTLLVVCFSMGTWIAGSYTTLGAMMVNERGYPLNVITPGLEKKDAITAIENLAKNYEQIIIAGYPPFIKDLIEYGNNNNLDWKAWKIGFTFAGEAISEDWRNHIHSLVSDATDKVTSVNIYGTADAGIVGHETPLSIHIRNKIDAAGLNEQFFGSSVSPSFLQYDPNIRHIEIVDKQVVFTAKSGIPLIRYNIKDVGGIYKLSDFSDLLNDDDLKNIDGYEYYKNFRFVYLHGRSDFTVTLYAVLIYPENIKSALASNALNKWVTSRFVMKTSYSQDMDQYMEIILELKEGVSEHEVPLDVCTQTIISTLKEHNAEYRKLHASIGEKAVPVVYVKHYGDPEYFPAGNKHKWVK